MRRSSARVRFSLLSAVLALAGAPPAPATPDGPPVEVVRVAQPASAGRLVAFDDSAVRLATPSGERVAERAGVVEVRFLEPGPRRLAGRSHLRARLVGGEVLLGAYDGPVADGLRLRTAHLGVVELPFDAVRALVSVPAGAGPCHEPERTRPASDAGDRAYTTQGDELNGIVTGADGQGVRFETARGHERLVRWDDLLVLHLANDAEAAGLAALPETAVEFETVDGDRLVAPGPVAFDGREFAFALRSLPGAGVRLPVPALRAVRPGSAAFRFASDLPFESTFTLLYGDEEGYEGAKLLEGWFAARADRRPSGCPLRLGGQTVRHGFAVHARSTVTIPLGGRWRTFRARFGIDDEAVDETGRPGGNVDARILGDGRVLWEAQRVRGGEPPREVGPLDLSGVGTLVLEVDFGEDLHVLDRATWADPMLQR